MISDGPHDSPSSTRRGFVAACGTVALASLAGCTAVVDWLGDAVLEDVNVLNATGEQVSGTVTVAGSDGTVVLEESFDLAGEDEDADAQAHYDDVWEGAGEYELDVELDDGVAVGGESSATEAVTIDDPDEEKLVVVFGDDEFDEPIHVDVIESISDLEEGEE